MKAVERAEAGMYAPNPEMIYRFPSGRRAVFIKRLSDTYGNCYFFKYIANDGETEGDRGIYWSPKNMHLLHEVVPLPQQQYKFA